MRVPETKGPLKLALVWAERSHKVPAQREAPCVLGEGRAAADTHRLRTRRAE